MCGTTSQINIAINECKHLLIMISPERIRDEFIKGIKSSKSITRFLGMLKEFNIFDFILPNLKVGQYVEEKNIPILLAYLLKSNDPQLVRRTLKNLKYTSDEIGKVYFLMLFKNFEPEMVYNTKKSQLLSKLTNHEIIRFAELTDMDIELVDKFLDFNLTVTGEDIEKLGIKPGPEMGRKIQELELENFLKTL